jgi:hypothetical protein
LDDPKVFKHVYWEGRYAGVFQFCVSEEAAITMADKTTKLLKDIEVGDKIISYNENDKIFETDIVEAVYDMGDKEVIRFTMEDGSILEVTSNHKVLTTNRGWVEAKELTTADDVRDFQLMGHS